MWSDEIGELSKADISPICFDCSSLGADKVLSHLLSGSENYFIGLGDVAFMFFWHQVFKGGDWHLCCKPIDQWELEIAKLENISAVTPLSSSTYLHKNLNVKGSQNG
jgi:hypothetical protein